MARGIHQRNEWIYATGPQVTYLRRLRNEAFAARYTVGYQIQNWDRLLKRDATKMISDLLAAKSKGWK